MQWHFKQKKNVFRQCAKLTELKLAPYNRRVSLVVDMVKKAQIYGVIRLQVWIAGVLTLLLAVLAGKNTALSGMAGSGVSLLGSLVYARIAFRAEFAPPAALLRLHFAAEMAKLALTLVVFAALFVCYRQVAALWVFIGYLAAASAYWFGLLFKFDGKK